MPSITGGKSSTMEEDEDNDLHRNRNIENVKVVSRDQWGAVEAKTVKVIKGDFTHLVASWTGTDTCSSQDECSKRMREIQDKDMNQDGLPDIKYNFLIGRDGNIYEGRGWGVSTNVSDGEEGKLTELDDTSLYVAFVGNRGDIPHPYMILAMAGLCNIGVNQGLLSREVKFVKIQKGDPTTHENLLEDDPSPYYQADDDDQDLNIPDHLESDEDDDE